jgi:surfactin synthase thioesterase subunit
MAVATLYCLPYAGAGTNVFAGWAKALAPTIDVRTVQLPGRGARLDDPVQVDPADLARAIAASIDRPYAFYGHSMGARLGFEVARELRRLGTVPPTRLYVGGSPSPDTPLHPTLAGLSRLDDDELMAHLLGLGAIPPEVARSHELRELVLPGIRADFGWLDAYRFVPEPPLSVPVVVLAGIDDPLVSASDGKAWARHTDAEVWVHELPGPHLFLHDERDRVLALVGSDLLAAVSGSHTLPLPGTTWSVWRDAIIRSPGFPADGLDRLAAPEAAALADAHLRQGGDDKLFTAAFAQAMVRCSEQAKQLAADPLLREALTWQNPDALAVLDGLLYSPRSKNRRKREQLVARYWQRYCGKNETIGFFGPNAWVKLTEGSEPVMTYTVDKLTRRRQVHLEQWAVQALADRLAEEPAIRRGLPVLLGPQWTLSGRELLRPAQPPVPVSALEAAALARSDGRRTAREVVAELAPLGLRSTEDGYLMLDRLVERGILQWPMQLPIVLHAPQILRQWLEHIDDDTARSEALAAFTALETARAEVADAAGNAEALREAIAALDRTFVATTGADPRRRAGQTYGGRAVCYEETNRDLDLELGTPVLTALAAPLDILLRGARWLTAAVVEAYDRALSDLYAELAVGGAHVRLSDMWYLAQGMIFGAVQRPAEQAGQEFVRRWAELFGLDELAPGTRQHQLHSGDLADAVAKAFPADRPGWSAARIHSPDLHLCATDVDALRRGDFFAVLGELHVAWPTFDCGVFTSGHPQLDRLRAGLSADLGRGRIRPLLPADWPRNTGRLAPTLYDRTDPQLGVFPAPGPDPDRLLRAGEMLISPRDGTLVATAPDGRYWPLLEAFAGLVVLHAVDGFKVVAAASHTPRITIDQLVVVRETWRTTIGDSGLADVLGDERRFLAGRRFVAANGLPDRVFAAIGTEVKPVYVDLRSPHYVSALITMMRTERERSGSDARLVLTEMLPTPEHAWLTDGSGARYFSELRIQIRDREFPSGPLLQEAM